VSYILQHSFFFIYTIDSQPTDKAEGVGEDFVRGGQDKAPSQKKRNSYERAVVKADTPTRHCYQRERAAFRFVGRRITWGCGYDFGLQ
jgi:hypothetical protein